MFWPPLLRGKPKKALALLREQEGVCRELSFTNDLATSLLYQAAILADRGESRGALRLIDEALSLGNVEAYVTEQLVGLREQLASGAGR